jgi:hypothetical protein
MFIQTIFTYFTENMMSLYYKDQPANALSESYQCLLYEDRNGFFHAFFWWLLYNAVSGQTLQYQMMGE